MQRLHFTTLAGLVCAASAFSAAAVPPNDACGNAIDVAAGGTYNGTLVDATADGFASCGFSSGNPDVWYTFTAPSNFFGTLNVNAQGSNAAYGIDTVFAVFTACGGTQLACNDDFFGLDSNIDLNLSPGQSVTIRVSKHDTRIVAPFILNVAFTLTAPSNDNCADAIDISGDGTTVGTLGASTPDGLGVCGGTQGAKDVWYRYTNTSGCQGSVDLTMCGTWANFAVDPVLSVFDACGGNFLACNDDFGGTGCTGLDSRIVYGLNPGQTIWIRVAPYADAYDRRFQISTTFTPLSNNACASPIRIFDGATNFCTDGATTDGPVEANCGFGFGDLQINQDVWYTYFATRSGVTTINTCANTNFDSKIGIYLGTCPTGPNSAITCNNDACDLLSSISFNATAGQIYTLRVGGFVGNAGSGTITIIPPPPCRVDFNDDGFLDFFDFDDFVNCFESEICPPGKTADYNNDDFVDFFDFDDFVTDFSNGC
jgi:hypothetical protein